jgi:integrase
MPTLRVLEAAALPVAPWRPLYWRDAAISFGGSLLLALLAMWLVELFNRSDPPATVVVAQALTPAFPAAPALQMRPGFASLEAALPSASPSLLPQAVTLPRELDHDEVVALLDAADDANSRMAMLLLLSGLSVEEAVGLRASSVDIAQDVIHLQGTSSRDVALRQPLRDLLAAQPAVDERVLMPGRRAVSEDDLDAQILCAAHDARLQRATEINANCLRHTYIAHLVRRGIRFADLQRVVGTLPAPVLGAYATLSPAGPLAGLDQIDMTPPWTRP